MMIKKLSIAYAVFFGALLLFTGCQSTVNTVENADRNMMPMTISDKRYVTDGFLRDRLCLSGLNISQTADGLMRVQLTAVNVRVGAAAQVWSWLTGENPYRILYKFTWFDSKGMEMPSILSTWNEIDVIPGETVYLQSVAPNRDCRDFRVNLREAE